MNEMARTTDRYSPQLVKAILPGVRDELFGGKHAWRIDALGCGPTLEEADFTDELSVHVPLQEGSSWVESSRAEFYDGPTSERVDSWSVWSLASRAVALACGERGGEVSNRSASARSTSKKGSVASLECR